MDESILKSSKLLMRLDDVGPSNNAWYQGLHWAVRKKEAKKWHDLVINQAIKYNVKAVKQKVILLYIQYSRPGIQLRDTTNCGLSAKLIEDGLVRAGILIDDNPDFVSATILMSKRSIDGKSSIEVRYINGSN